MDRKYLESYLHMEMKCRRVNSHRGGIPTVTQGLGSNCCRLRDGAPFSLLLCGDRLNRQMVSNKQAMIELQWPNNYKI